jgi:8-oxo-dGTP pyrophosphatase MutT (NUDIX family)
MTVTLRDGDLELRSTRGGSGFTGFAIIVGPERVGTVAYRNEGKTIASLRWNTSLTDAFVVARALTLAIKHAVEQSGFARIEARLTVTDTHDIRAASIAGLRREGIVRMPNGSENQVLMARLSTDAPAASRDGFIAILNAGLPTKRVIGQGMVRDERGRVLLCELTYKSEWDLPGGVIEVGEPPAVGLVRELKEELGVDFTVQGLITVNWLPAWRGWDDACIFLFDLGTIAADSIEDMTLQASEIKGVHWCEPDQVRDRATAAAIELLDALERGDLPSYREAPKAAE